MALNPSNSYLPYYYQPHYIQPPTMQQAPTQSMVWVRDKAEADAYPIAPNTAIALWDSSSPCIYLKQTDVSGRPSIKTFDLVERSNLAEKPFEEPAPNYVSHDDLKTLSDEIKAIRSDIEKMSVDLYGIAGKKKAQTTKKTEEE